MRQLQLLLTPELISGPAQEMKATLVIEQSDILMVDDEVLSLGDSLGPSDEPNNLRVVGEESFDDVMPARELPAVEANAYP